MKQKIEGGKKEEIAKVVKEFKEIFDIFPELNSDVRQSLLIRIQVRLGEFWDKGRLELDDEIRKTK